MDGEDEGYGEEEEAQRVEQLGYGGKQGVALIPDECRQQHHHQHHGCEDGGMGRATAAVFYHCRWVVASVNAKWIERLADVKAIIINCCLRKRHLLFCSFTYPCIYRQ